MTDSLGNFPVIASLFAGILTFISPCVLPLIPAYITFITGISVGKLNDKQNMSSVLLNSVVFVTGFSLIFVLLGLSVTYIGSLLGNNIDILRWAGGIIIIIFGLHLTGIFKISLFYRQASSFGAVKKSGYISVFFIGCAFAVGWTPCVGPILSSILILASTQGEVINGAILLAVYSLGLGIPLILTALFINKFFKLFNSVKRYYNYIETAAGILLIITGILMITDSFKVLTGYIMAFMP